MLDCKVILLDKVQLPLERFKVDICFSKNARHTSCGTPKACMSQVIALNYIILTRLKVQKRKPIAYPSFLKVIFSISFSISIREFLTSVLALVLEFVVVNSLSSS